jgi:hypothetical protein
LNKEHHGRRAVIVHGNETTERRAMGQAINQAKNNNTTRDADRGDNRKVAM